MAVRPSAILAAACAAAFALALAGAPALADSHEKGGSDMGMEGGMEKADLASEVSKKLHGEGLSNVTAMAEGSAITLQGTVAKSGDRERAAELASSIEGVESVKNEIEVDVASPPAGESGGY